MDILNAPAWARAHAQRPDIRAIKAERRVIARYGEDSPQVRELHAIPISRPHAVLERAEQLLMADHVAKTEKATMLAESLRALSALVDVQAKALTTSVLDNVRLRRTLARKARANRIRKLVRQQPDAVPVITRLEQTVREQKLQIARLEDQLATNNAAELREGMDMLRRHLRPRGYTQPNLLDAVKAVCQDAEHYRRMASLAQSQIEQVKRGYEKDRQALAARAAQ